MPQYLRALVPGGTFFFTVTLLERRRKLLTEHVDNFRVSLMVAGQRRPFTVEAMVILPDRRLEIEYAEGGMRFAFPPYGLRASMTRVGASDGARDSTPILAGGSDIYRKLW
jgi:hypothetical protein